MIIVFCNSLMQPSNLKFICRGKLQIHMCNMWTTMTCLWAATVDNQDQDLHFAILFPGWFLILSCLWGYEAILFKNDVFRQPIGDAANILACQTEAGELRRKLTARRGVLAWGAHALVVRLVRMCAHADVPVQLVALKHLLRLCYEDQMTTGALQAARTVPPATQCYNNPVVPRCCRMWPVVGNGIGLTAAASLAVQSVLSSWA